MALKHYTTTILILMLGIFLACEETSDVNIAYEPTKLIVVEAVMTNENINHVVRLSSTYTIQNVGGDLLNGASMTISDGSNVVQLNPADSGRYITPRMRFVSGKQYILNITYGGEEFTAQDQAVPVEPLQPLAYSPAPGGYRFNFFETGTQPNYIKYDVQWKDTTEGFEPSKARLIFYDLKTVDANEIFKPAKTDFIFPKGSTVIRKKYSASPAYQTYLRSMLSETEWRGSVFDIQRDNPTTNLSKGAIGFFAVTTVVSDTLVIR